MNLLKILRTPLALGMTVGQWLACLAAAPSGAIGWVLIVRGTPWGGVALLAAAQFIYYALMGHDLEDR